MQAFTNLTGIAAPMPLINIDTDMIIPKQYLKTIERTGLGRHLFAEMRYDADGNELSDFILNQAAFRQAQILVAGANFGCGSSREHAPWAILDYGIRCIIAPSFADIFFNNCFKNGILPIVLPADIVARLSEQIVQPGATLSVDLVNRTVTGPDGQAYSFDVDDFRRHCLLNGLDDIGLTLSHADQIATFEAQDRVQRPWLYQGQ